MNDFHSSFATGQVIHSDGEADAEALDPRQSLVSHIEKYNGCSDCATQCLKQTERIAEIFNHSTVGVAHLVAAMTLVPCALRAFQLRNIDVTAAFRSAMLSLIEMERVKPGDPVAKTSSGELNNILILAGNIAKERDFQEVSVHDLLTALNSLPADAPAAEPIRGGTRSQVQNLRAELEVFAKNLSEGLSQRIHELLPPPQPQQPVIDFQTRSDISDIKRDLQALNAHIAELRSRVQPERPPETMANPGETTVEGPQGPQGPQGPEQPGWLRNVFG